MPIKYRQYIASKFRSFLRFDLNTKRQNSTILFKVESDCLNNMNYAMFMFLCYLTFSFILAANLKKVEFNFSCRVNRFLLLLYIIV